MDKELINSTTEKRYLAQSDGFLRIALILGLRHCLPEEALGIRENLEPRLHAALEEVLQILVSDLNAKAASASPLAQVLPKNTRTLKDLFERPIRKRAAESITVRYGGTTGGSRLDSSSLVELEESQRDWRFSGVIAGLSVVLILTLLLWFRRREQ